MAKRNLFAFPLRLSMPNGLWDQLYGAILKQEKFEAYNSAWLKLLFSFSSHQVIHIHWPEVIYGEGAGIVVLLRTVFRLGILMISKFRGDTLIWTCHNFHSHERRNIKIETFVMNFLAHRSDAIIVHTMIGKQYIMERFGRTDAVYIIPHGNYIGFHGARLTSPDPELVQELGLQPDDKIFISLGNIRPYKGLERLLGVFRNMPNNYKCIIAGKGFPTEYVTKLQQLSPQNIIWRLGRVDHEDIPRYFSLARVAVFTFEDVLSSGSVILALSYGLPAIVPPVGDLTQIIQQQVNGYFFNSDDELGVIIKKVATLTTAEVQHQKEQSLASVTHLHYEELARQTLKIYNIQHG